MSGRCSSADELPDRIESEGELEELLSRPGAEVVELFGRLKGSLAIVGGAGKIGPSLTQMAVRARSQAGGVQEIIVIDRFPDRGVRDRLEALGAKTVTCDLLDPDAVSALPLTENVVYMVGMKFGTSDQPELTWAINALIPDYVVRRYRDARMVVFSTGCVYDFVDATCSGSVETDPLEPPGEYSNSCVARERIFQYCSRRYATEMVLVRLNYAVETRYGVLVDIAQNIAADRPVDLTMGYANVIWGGDVNAAMLRLIEHASSPPAIFNLTGAEKISIRHVAQHLAELMNKQVRFTSEEGPTALLSNSCKAHKLLGPPGVPTEKIVEWTAHWIAQGKPTLNKPTHFQTTDGRY